MIECNIFSVSLNIESVKVSTSRNYFDQFLTKMLENAKHFQHPEQRLHKNIQVRENKNKSTKHMRNPICFSNQTRSPSKVTVQDTKDKVNQNQLTLQTVLVK